MQSLPSLYLSILVPVRDERDNLRPLLREIADTLKVIGKPAEVIVVDDGSVDDSVALLKEEAKTYPFLKIVAFRKSFGQSAALDAGLQRAEGEVIVLMDGDGQNDPRDIPTLLAKI